MNDQDIPVNAVSNQFSSPVKYNSTAVDARASLVSGGWNITDQGLLEDDE